MCASDFGIIPVMDEKSIGAHWMEREVVLSRSKREKRSLRVRRGFLTCRWRITSCWRSNVFSSRSC